MKYRIYIDESGNPDLENADNSLYRFLSLTGVIISLDHVAKVVAPEMEELKKKYFPYHPDEPIIFHRKELVNKKPPFERLQDAAVENEFNADLLTFLTNVEYLVITVLIDKKEQRELYKAWRYDPYHYCLAVLLERLVRFLENTGEQGDTMAESRGGKEDMRLKKSYEKLFSEGTSFVDAKRFQAKLTSKQLKVKPKQNNIAGLQIADLVAHPSQRYILKQHGRIEDDRQTFGDRIVEVLVRQKYYRSQTGSIDGYGIKLLP